jgi:hypothetical protein
MDLTKKRYDISYDTDETVTTEDTGYYTGTISAGTLHPGYGAVPPNNAGSGTVIISTPDATATYTPTSLTVAPKYANTTISSNGLSSGTGYTYNLGTGGGSPWATGTTASAGKLNLLGEDADLVINGKSLVDTLQALEERLNILVPNQELEKEWKELKKVGDKYRKLEKELKEKTKMWDTLKK